MEARAIRRCKQPCSNPYLPRPCTEWQGRSFSMVDGAREYLVLDQYKESR
jgi:hypothetical protein